jgi:hypothetical protein
VNFTLRFLCASILICGVCAADELTLPLQGYFHPGRAMPVRWDFSQPPPSGSQIILTGDGAITSRVSGISLSQGIFPWLAIRPNINQIRAQTPGGAESLAQPLHPLADAQRLVGVAGDVAGDDLSAAAALFSGESVVSIRLDSLHPIAGPASAWESLDGLLLTPAQWGDLSRETRRGLFAAGVTIAVSGNVRPGNSFAWQQSERWWIARPISLPRAVNPDAFAPTEGWDFAAPAELRRKTVLLGILFGIFAGAVGLWRNRWTPAALAVIAAMFCMAAGAKYSAPRIGLVRGTVRIAGTPPLADLWSYLQSRRDADFNIAADGIVLPIFLDESQPDRCELLLNCDGAGEPISLSGRLRAEEPIALFCRIVSEQLDPATAAVTSPLRALATPAIYPGLSIAGQNSSGTSASDDPARWPTIQLK